MRYFIILFLLFSTAIASAAPSKPSVSGTVLKGSTLSISGSSFGAKSTAAPLKWDNFEAGTLGSKVGTPTVGTAWNLYGADDTKEPVYSNTITRTGSTKSSKHAFTGGNWDSAIGIESGTLGTTFLDGWIYIAAFSPYSRNFKPWRLYGNWSGDANVSFYFNLYCASQDSSHLTQDGGGTTDWWIGTYDANYFGGKWVHIQQYVVQSGAGQNNGTVYLNIDGTTVVSSTTANTRGSSDPAWSTLWVGFYGGHDAVSECGAYGDFNVYWDDVYVDTTPAHVEICSGSTWASKGHCEIQIPTAWSTSSVSATANVGSFSVGSSVYLYVVDSTGGVSPASDPITIGSGVADTVNPSVEITSPTAASTYDNGTAISVSIGGTSSDNIAVSSVTWTCPTCSPSTGSTTGTTTWAQAGIGLSNGSNTITVTARDAAGNSGSDTLTVSATLPVAQDLGTVLLTQ